MAQQNDTQRHPLRPPPWYKTLGEFRVVLDLARTVARRKKVRRKSHGDPVLVLPGFGTNDAVTVLLRKHLTEAGFRVHTWNLGINRGPRSGVMARLSQRVRSIAKSSGRPLQLVGWSLGGLMARVIAGRLPKTVSHVVALGSPLSAEPNASRLSCAFAAVAGKPSDDPSFRSMLRDSARAPVTSIYSRADGVVAWQSSVDAPGKCRAHEVQSTHLGMMIDAGVHAIVATELARSLAV